MEPSSFLGISALTVGVLDVAYIILGLACVWAILKFFDWLRASRWGDKSFNGHFAERFETPEAAAIAHAGESQYKGYRILAVCILVGLGIS